LVIDQRRQHVAECIQAQSFQTPCRHEHRISVYEPASSSPCVARLVSRADSGDSRDAVRNAVLAYLKESQ
jgi:hypothetical protein